MSLFLLAVAEYQESFCFLSAVNVFFWMNRQIFLSLVWWEFMANFFLEIKQWQYLHQSCKPGHCSFGKPLKQCKSWGSLVLNNDAFWVSLVQQLGWKNHWRKNFHLGKVHQHFLACFSKIRLRSFFNSSPNKSLAYGNNLCL